MHYYFKGLSGLKTIEENHLGACDIGIPHFQSGVNGNISCQFDFKNQGIKEWYARGDWKNAEELRWVHRDYFHDQNHFYHSEADMID